MEIHLLSSPGEVGIEAVLAASREILARRRKPQVAYLPAASLYRRWVRETRAAFKGLAAVTVIDPQRHAYESIQSALDRADLLYMPGGNTYLLAQRLNAFRRPGLQPECEVEPASRPPALIESAPAANTLMAEIRRRALAGLPIIGVSAGAVVCGPDVLTTNDINACGCTCFTGLGLLPFYLNPHYPAEPGPPREARLDRLQEFLHFHPQQTVAALEDGAYLRAAGGEIHRLAGRAWRITYRQEPVLFTD